MKIFKQKKYFELNILSICGKLCHLLYFAFYLYEGAFYCFFSPSAAKRKSQMHFLETAIAIVYVVHELKAWNCAVPNCLNLNQLRVEV